MSNLRPGQDRQGGARRRAPNTKHRDDVSHARTPAGALVCPDCGLVHHAGRWYEGQPPLTEVASGRCPACERVRAQDPAGVLTLPAALVQDREELERSLRNAAAAEAAEHPLERLMGVAEGEDGSLVVTTTGIHLARRLANLLERQVHRQARFDFVDGVELLRVSWDES
jgi:hypothetical protein